MNGSAGAARDEAVPGGGAGRPAPPGSAGPAGPPGPVRAAGYALALLTVLNLLSYVDRNVLFALFEPIKDDLGLTDSQLGWLGSAYVLPFSLAALPFGILSDLRARERIVAVGVVVWCSAAVLSGLAAGFWTLLVCRALIGIGAAAFGSAATSLVADLFPGRGRAGAMATFTAGLVLGGGLGLWLGGMLGEHYGWRAAFIATGVPGLLLAGLALRLTDPTLVDGRPAAADDSVRELLRRTAREIGTTTRTVMRNRTLSYIFGGGALISFGMNGLVGWAPSFVSRELDISVKAATDMLGWRLLLFGAIGTLAGGLVADWLRRRFVAARLVTCAVGLVAGGLLCIWALTEREPARFTPVFCAAVFFLTWYNGPLTASIFDVVPTKISAAIAGAYLLFIHLVGDTIAFPLVGQLSDRFGIDQAVFLLPVVSLVGGLIVLAASPGAKRDMIAEQEATAG